MLLEWGSTRLPVALGLVWDPGRLGLVTGFDPRMTGFDPRVLNHDPMVSGSFPLLRGSGPVMTWRCRPWQAQLALARSPGKCCWT